MAEYKLNKTLYPKSIYEKVINTSFSQNKPSQPLEETIDISQFFELYNKIFYDIPVEGDINSHAFLVKTSGNYIGLNINDNNDDVQILLDEITSL